MKMTQSDYNLLESHIQGLMLNLELNLDDCKQKYHEAGLSMMRFRWDLYHACNPRGKLFKHFSNYLNDSHIDTALRKITGTK